MNVLTTFIIIQVFISVLTEQPVRYPPGKCKRECKSPPENAICKFDDWIVDSYYTLSQECLNCPFNVTDCNLLGCIASNGVERGVLVVNRKLPGPKIEACEGDTLEINTVNQLDNGEGLSLHWHGLHARKHQYMDGVAMLTQCPITTASSFLYSFEASPAGTHWWHSHSGIQRGDGLFGALIVRKAKEEEIHSELYDYDEHVMIVNDWFDKVIMDVYASYRYSNTGDSNPHSILINGKGIHKPVENEYKNMTANTTREIFTVDQGKRYRFRTIGASLTGCGLKISVDGHNITLIATDGVPIVPQEADSFIIYAGERYDFVLNATQDVDNYWIRVNTVDCNDVFELAILRYAGAPDEDPSEPEIMTRQGITVNTVAPGATNVEKNITVGELKQLKPSILQKVDKTHYIGLAFTGFTDIYSRQFNVLRAPSITTFLPQLNNLTFMLPSSPPLSQFEDIPDGTFCSEETVDEQICDTDFCQCTHTINITLNDVVEFVVVNYGPIDAAHPMHLHGYYFQVVGSDTFDKEITLNEVMEMDKEGRLNRNATNPVMKDTIIVPYNGYAILRFHADNPGWWFFHCHIEFHVQDGMALFVRVGEQSDLPEPPKNFPKCGNFPSNAGSQQKGSSVSTIHGEHTLAIIMLSLIIYFI